MKRTKFVVFSSLAASALVLSLFFTNCSGMGFEIAEQGCIDDGGDPFFGYSWHLDNCGQSVFAAAGGTSGVDLNLQKTWTNKIYGTGILVRISDDGLENTHEDLTDNFVTGKSRDYVAKSSSPWDSSTAVPRTGDYHGTSVAGLIAAVGWNGLGSRGVAPKASLAVANFLSNSATQTNDMFLDQAQGDFDVLNMSWGSSQNVLTSVYTPYESVLKTTVTSNRSGKGAILVKASGNSFYVRCYNNSSSWCIGSSNFDGDNTNPYQIVVAALNASGVSASYSSGGSNVWISGFGGEYGYDKPAMFSTDLSGCSNGYASSTPEVSSIAFEKGSNGNTKCNYTTIFNGTSSAAPTVSGAAALLLQANSSLTWRDVKYILAKTAVPMDYVTTGSIKHPLGSSVPSGYAWEQPWVTNKAGFPFHNWYGFGKVDVDAAVTMAQSYTSALGTYTEEGWSKHVSSGLSVTVPDNSASGVTQKMTVASTDNLKIESVRLKIAVTHADISELAIELTSPSGTKSILVNMRNALGGIANYEDDIFLSNAFFQESSQGEWTLRVVDGRSGNVGTLTSWSLNISGGK